MRLEPPSLVGASQLISTAELLETKLVVGEPGVEGTVAAFTERADEVGPSPKAFTAETSN